MTSSPSVSLFHRVVAALLLPLHVVWAMPLLWAPGARGAEPGVSTGAKPYRDAYREPWVPPAPALSAVVQQAAHAPVVQGPDYRQTRLPEVPELSHLHECRAFRTSLAPDPQQAFPAGERRALGRLMERYVADRGAWNYANLAQLDGFLAAQPNASTRMSVLVEKAALCRQHGNFRRSLEALREAWRLGAGRTDAAGRVQAESALSDLLGMLARLGLRDELKASLEAVQGRASGGALREAIYRGREALWFFDHKAEHNIFCGFTATNMVCVPRGQAPIFPDVDDEEQKRFYIQNGLSLFELRAHSRAAGGELKIVKRTAGTAIPVPCVMHWSMGHYSAVTEQNGDLYRVRDRHLKLDTWMPAAALNEQCSGYFLLPQDTVVPAGMSPVGDAEAKTVFGRHCIHARDDQGCNGRRGCPTSGGPAMTTYDFFVFNPGLSLDDTPIRYATPLGEMTFAVHYNERSSATALPDAPSYSNFGPRWTFDFVDHVTITGTGTPATSLNYVDGSGSYFTYNYDAAHGVYSTRYANLPQMQALPADGPAGYQLTLGDGSRKVFSQPAGGAALEYFLTELVDAQGNTTTFRYDAQMRLIAIVDPFDQATVLSYAPQAGDVYPGALDPTGQTPGDAWHVRKITDPFGRAAQFLYTATGRLWRIVDPMGIVSEFHYGAGDFVDRLTTPYGVTTFVEGEEPGTWVPGRFIEATDPYGDKERAEQNDNALYPPSGTDANPPPTDANGVATVKINGQDVSFLPKLDNLYWRNTYVWDKSALHTAVKDYAQATIYNWLADDSGTITSVLGSLKRPLEGRIWFNYTGQVSAHAPGVVSAPAKVLRAVEDAAGATVWTLRQTSYTYTLPDGTTATQPWGKPTGETDAEGRQLRYLYDASGRDLTNIQVYDGTAWQNLSVLGGYSRHLPGTVTDTTGAVTTLTYNTLGQVTLATVSKAGHTESTRFSYDRDGDGKPDADGYLLSIEHTDPAHPGSFVTMASYTRDTLKRVRTATDESGYTRQFDYDNFDRVTLITHPDATTEQYVYENLDLVAQKDRGGLWQRIGYNALRQPIVLQDPQGRLTQYEWCRCGDLRKLIDPMGKVTWWKRDLEGRVYEKLLPDGVTKTTFAYQPLSGRIASMTTPNDQDSNHATVSYSYYPGGRLRAEQYTDPGTPSVSYAYQDPLGRLSSFTTAGLGDTKYQYRPFGGTADGAGLLWTVDGPQANDTVRYSYDWQGRLALREIVSDNDVVTRSEGLVYDSLGRITQVDDGNVNAGGLGLFTYTYNPGNLSEGVDTIGAANGMQSAYNYYPASAPGGQALRLQSILHSRAGTTISQFGYAYDASGRINSWSQQAGADAAAGQTYTLGYNRSSELTDALLRDSAGNAVQTLSYRYDASGNRRVAGDATSATVSQANVLNQLTQVGGGGKTLVEGTVSEKARVTVNGVPAQVTAMPGSSLVKYQQDVDVTPGANTISVQATDASGNARTNNYQVNVSAAAQKLNYDNNGNLLSDGTRTFTWDAKNRLIGLAIAGDNYFWSYDGADRRVAERKNGAVIRQWIWDGSNMVAERDASGKVQRTFFAAGEVISSGTNTPVYYARDHLGSVRAATDFSGKLCARYEYDVYGKRQPNSISDGPIEISFGYTGHYYAASLQLDLALYRIYDPILGRWLSGDAMGEGEGSNLYAYAANSPIGASDRFGLCIDNDNATPDSVAFVGQQLGDAGAVRATLDETVRGLDPFDSAGRTAAKAAARAQTPPLVRGPLESIRPGLGARPGSVGHANVPNSGASALGAAFKWAGRGLVVVGLAVDAYNIYNSPCKIKATLEAAFGMLGALGLGSAGAALGAAAGGVGAVPLGIGGSMLGGYLGRKAADLIYDSFF